MNMGVVTGGWEFVWAAYGITAAALVWYSVHVLLRLRGERARAVREAQRSSEVSP